MSRQEEPVFADKDETLRFYCCGPTVYAPAHIGNFRTFLLQDLFRRVIEATGLQTCHVRNVTDVDDKTIRGANENGESLSDFTAYWRAKFEADASELNCLPPHHAPSAVAHIPEQIALTEKLISKGLAYVADDHSVYYRISAFPDYGKLAGLNMEEMRPNADQRLNTSDEYDKESLNDFALWKAWKPEDGDFKWESPWGPGRPGWHLECSTMSMIYLGESFDLHSGGVDLKFPHHENEIAQSEGATGKPFVRHWFHINHLRVENQKMSKSLGNLYTLAEIKEWGFTPSELRYVLLSGHYRQPLNFSRESLTAAHSALQRIQKAAQNLGAESLSKSGSTTSIQSTRYSGVLQALCEDLNTPNALGKLHTALGNLEKEIKSNTLSEEDKPAEIAALESVCALLGVWPENKDNDASATVPDKILQLAEERLAAKTAKDWQKADALRDQIAAQGWQVKDSKHGYDLEKEKG